MDHFEIVSACECARDLNQNRQRAIDRDFAAIHQLGEGGTLEQLHHQVQAAVAGFALLEDLDDVGMRDLLRRLGLAPEPLLGHLILRELDVHDLDRDRTIAQSMPGAIHGRHAAFAEHFLDQVAAGDSGTDPRILDVDQCRAVDEARGFVSRVFQLALRAGFHERGAQSSVKPGEMPRPGMGHPIFAGSWSQDPRP